MGKKEADEGRMGQCHCSHLGPGGGALPGLQRGPQGGECAAGRVGLAIVEAEEVAEALAETREQRPSQTCSVHIPFLAGKVTSPQHFSASVRLSCFHCW